MELITLQVAGGDTIRVLNDNRSRYSTTGLYPVLIGDAEALARIKGAAEFNEQDPNAIIAASFDIKIADWIARRRKEAEEPEFSPDELLGEWPGEISEKGSISLHKDVLSAAITPVVYVGLARIDEPWHLPAAVKFGDWNECPEPEVHCAFHREWHERYGAQITGMSGDIVECVVTKPPADREAATILAWEQYWYCADIVNQGCGSILDLAATLLNSPYWFFWWH